MNNIFLVVFTLLFLILLLFDLKRIRMQHKSIKRLYITLYILTGGTFICMLLGIKLPSPTRFFLNQVSPRVFDFIYS